MKQDSERICVRSEDNDLGGSAIEGFGCCLRR